MRNAPQIEGTKRDTGRLVQENNQLHQQLIHAAESSDQQRSQHYQRVKELEGEIAGLSFWKNQAQARFDRSEGEVRALKERLEELLKLGAPRSECDLHMQDAAAL